MAIHLVNPSDNSFGTAVITPRWLFVLAAATPLSMGDPILVDESLEQLNPETIRAGDVVGISVHTGNALRGYAIGKLARYRGATVVYGGIHATLFPEEPFERGGADVVVTGDGDVGLGASPARSQCRMREANLQRGQARRRRILGRTLGSDADGQIYVGVRSDDSRLPEALLVLLRLAHRWAETSPTVV